MLKNYFILPPSGEIPLPEPAQNRQKDKQPENRPSTQKTESNPPGDNPGISIRTLMNAINGNSGTTNEGQTGDLPKEEFTHKEFMAAWDAYIAQEEKKGKKILTSFLKSQKPTLTGYTIQLTFTGKHMADEIRINAGNILKFLRKKLNNYALDINIELRQEPREKTRKKLYTPGEIFVHLHSKNPLLKDLKEKFGLHIS